MSPLTLRLRLIAAAITLAAALGGAFLVSSAPAQTTVPAPLVPTPQELQYHAEQKQDLQNLKAIGSAITQYIQDHNERMPDAAHWMDQIASYRRDPNLFFDPLQPGKHRYGYAFNRNCSSKTMMVTKAPAETVIVFDSTLGTRNASDTGQSLQINPPPASKLPYFGSNYLFIDGHPKFFRQGIRPSFSLEGGQPTALNGSQPRVGLNKLVIYSEGNVRIHGILNNGTTVLQASAVPDQQLGQAQLLAGLTPVQGPGVVVTLTGSRKPVPSALPTGFAPPNLIHDSDINQVVNELRAAGAEAIAVNGQRLVATSSIRTAGSVIYVNEVIETAPYTIKAIGNSAAMLAAQQEPGGIASQIKTYDPTMYSAQAAKTLILPAYTGTDRPHYARLITEAMPPNKTRQIELSERTLELRRITNQLNQINHDLHQQH